MFPSTRLNITPTLSLDGHRPQQRPEELMGHYTALVDEKRLSWTTHHQLTRLLGSGGQGVVYLTERRGADGFTLPIALKIFSPEHFEDAAQYSETMERLAHVASRVARIQHDNLLDVQNFVDRNRIRMMVMEWIDGYDLRQLLDPRMLGRVQDRVSKRRWGYISRVIATAGPVQTRFKPGIAVAVLRDGLAAIAALHREGIVHGDIKPSNIMLNRTGCGKLIDIGSAFEIADPPARRTCTPVYAAPEILEGGQSSPRSDLASLGYVLIEMLAGRPLFEGARTARELLEAKRFLGQRLHTFLPSEVTCNELLMKLCSGLIAPDPMRRFPTAEDAELHRDGAAAFHRQLVMSDLASEYDNELRVWLEELREIDELEDGDSKSSEHA